MISQIIMRKQSINLEYSMIGELDYNELIHTIKKEGKFGFKFIISNDNYIEDKIVALGIKTQGVPTKIVYLQEDKKNFIDSFKLIFEDKSIEKIGHNLKSDIVILSRLGIKIDNITFDSMIAQYLINPAQSSYTINEISKEYLNVYGMDEESLLGKGKSKRSF